MFPAGRWSRTARGPIASRGRQICTCFDVSEPLIESTLAQCGGSEDQRLSQLQQTLRCGTNCGSCVPELRKLVRARMVAA